jgi:hypothetical protein
MDADAQRPVQGSVSPLFAVVSLISRLPHFSEHHPASRGYLRWSLFGAQWSPSTAVLDVC